MCFFISTSNSLSIYLSLFLSIYTHNYQHTHQPTTIYTDAYGLVIRPLGLVLASFPCCDKHSNWKRVKVGKGLCVWYFRSRSIVQRNQATNSSKSLKPKLQRNPACWFMHRLTLWELSYIAQEKLSRNDAANSKMDHTNQSRQPLDMAQVNLMR